MIFVSAIAYGQGRKKYKVVINSNPPDAEVYANGKYLKNTPCGYNIPENFKLKITIQKDGYEIWTKNYVVQSDLIINPKLISLSSGLNSSNSYPLKIDSTPTGADVYINGKFQGTTPYSELVAAGSRLHVVIVKENYKKWDQTIIIDEDIHKTIKLEKATKFKKRYWFIPGVAIVGSGLIYYFTTQNDDGPNDSNQNWPLPPVRP